MRLCATNRSTVRGSFWILLANRYYDERNRARSFYVKVGTPYSEPPEEEFLALRRAADADNSQYYDFGVTSDADFVQLNFVQLICRRPPHNRARGVHSAKRLNIMGGPQPRRHQ